MTIKKLNFIPLKGLSSRHLQTILSSIFPKTSPPPSKAWLVEIGNGNFLCCEISTPPHWHENEKTIALVHGLGGSHTSNYMIRIAKKFYLRGYRVVRVNLRGCGSGKGLSTLPYHAGNSDDVRLVIESLKSEYPNSEITLIGFSLGGNIALKLAGELGNEAKKLIKTFIAVCPPFDLTHTVSLIEKKRHKIYRTYFLNKMHKQGKDWLKRKIKSISEFDNTITAPLWGYQDACDFYTSCSSSQFLPLIEQTSHILFAEDDPFINIDKLKTVAVSKHVHLWTTEFGGHMGFLGRTSNSRNFYWMDQLLLNWVEEDFTSDHKV